jgi:hypothetical protein
MPRRISIVPLPSGEGSPACTLRMSATPSGWRQIATEIDAAQVEIGDVGAADEVAHRGHRAVDDQR